jgi:ABC-type oligopeptide transport system substrate-binding subunit
MPQYQFAPEPYRFTDVAGRERPRRLRKVGLVMLLLVSVGVVAVWHPLASAATSSSVTILGPSATSLDPAVQADAGSAQVVSQLFESLTSIDSAETVQPALAQSWDVASDGSKIVFHLRSGLTFSDGSALKAGDVVTSWLRVLSPSSPSQLAPLLDGVKGAKAYREGTGQASAVGIRATSDTDLEVDLTSGAVDFPAIVSSSTLAVVPPGLDANPSYLRPGTFVGSGAYILSALSATETTLKANPHYWAGAPAMATVHLVNGSGGLACSDEVDQFTAGTVDYTPVCGGDATWIAYDKKLGPSLRLEPSPSVEYYGFNTTKAPFNDVHVRRAFQLGIDWRRVVTLMDVPGMVSATGMVPIGVPGHSTTDFGPVFDLATAKSELAAAGYANGVGFPKVTLITTGGDGGQLEGAILQQLHDNLGVDISYRVEAGDFYNNQLLTDAPAFWQMGWVADYPGANDFLGLLLGSGQTNNFAGWSNSEFDADISSALSATDQTTSQQAFDKAQAVVKDQAPVIPVDYSSSYTLVARGLLGALPNSQGLVRYAGMSWAIGQ